MADLIVTDPSGVDTLVIDDYELDLAWGEDENDFELTVRQIIPSGAYIYLDGSECGGIIDAMRDQLTADGSTLTYSGRTWHGILAGKILAPDPGRDYLTVTGNASTILQNILQRVGLTPRFRAVQPPGIDPQISQYRFARYVDAYAGLRAMCKANKLKIRVAYRNGHADIWVEPATHYDDTIDSDLIDFDATRTWRTVNHMIGLGKGDLAARTVTHWYADGKGSVSQQQTLHGTDEITQVFDYSNAERDKLDEETRKKLQDLQTQGDVSVTVREGSGITLDVGDTVTARDHATGITVDAAITKKIVKTAGGIMTVDYEAK